MKLNKKIFIFSIAAIMCVLLCSCSRSSMRNTGDAMKRTARRAENFVENGIDNITNPGMYGYGANNGYSGYVGNGTGTALPNDGNVTPILPTLRDKSKDNRGQINTNNGSLDGGMGDIYKDNSRKRNSVRRDMLVK